MRQCQMLHFITTFQRLINIQLMFLSNKLANFVFQLSL